MIGYLILVHRYADQFKRLFQAIYDVENHYVIHVDRNSGVGLEAEIREFLSPYANAELIRSEKAIWGGYSLVDAELRGIERLLQMGPWSHFISLSGQDFPLKTQRQIMEFLDANQGVEFIKVLNQEEHRPDTMHRVSEYVVEMNSSIVRSTTKRPYLEDAVPYIGNQWMVVTRAFCQFVCRDPSVDRYKAFYENTLIADEGFFQTVMMNSGQPQTIINDGFRMIDWIADGDIKLRPRTYDYRDADKLTSSPNLFARKFDQTVDGEILRLLEKHLELQDAAISAPLNLAPAAAA